MIRSIFLEREIDNSPIPKNFVIQSCLEIKVCRKISDHLNYLQFFFSNDSPGLIFSGADNLNQSRVKGIFGYLQLSKFINLLPITFLMLP